MYVSKSVWDDEGIAYDTCPSPIAVYTTSQPKHFATANNLLYHYLAVLSTSLASTAHVRGHNTKKNSCISEEKKISNFLVLAIKGGRLMASTRIISTSYFSTIYQKLIISQKVDNSYVSTS